MVTVREQLPGRLNELSQETTVEHAEQAHQDLTEWWHIRWRTFNAARRSRPLNIRKRAAKYGSAPLQYLLYWY